MRLWNILLYDFVHLFIILKYYERNQIFSLSASVYYCYVCPVFSKYKMAILS